MPHLKILIVRFSSIGDIVLTSPIVRCLKLQLGAEVHFLTKTAFASFQHSNPYIDKVFSFEKNITDIAPTLKAEQYDWIIDLHHNLRSVHLKIMLGRPSRSFDKINFQKWLLVQCGINVLPQTHIVHRYMDTVTHLGVKYDGQGLDFFIPEKEKVNLNHNSVDSNATEEDKTSFTSLDMLKKSLKPNEYTAFVIGATHATKRLPEEKITEICKGINQKVVLLGGKAEFEIGARIAAQSGSMVLNACGALNLFQSASIVKQSSQVVTHDTGLMHIAAAFNKNIVSIWGNTVPAFGMTPFFKEVPEKNVIIQNSDLSCRPCSKIGFDNCPKGHFRCMQDLENVQIINEINR
jgi:ADP-heptose:LPS heptosyltransferase